MGRRVSGTGRKLYIQITGYERNEANVHRDFEPPMHPYIQLNIHVIKNYKDVKSTFFITILGALQNERRSLAVKLTLLNRMDATIGAIACSIFVRSLCQTAGRSPCTETTGRSPESSLQGSCRRSPALKSYSGHVNYKPGGNPPDKMAVIICLIRRECYRNLHDCLPGLRTKQQHTGAKFSVCTSGAGRT